MHYFISAVMPVLEATADGKLPSEKVGIGEAFLVLLICMTVIMGILLVLMGILYGFKLFGVVDKKKAEKAAAADSSAGEIGLGSEIEDDDDVELAAVIAAALGICTEREGECLDGEVSAPFRIKSIKRIK